MTSTHYDQGNPENYTIGGSRIWFNELLDSANSLYRGFRDLGNIVASPQELSPDMLEHYTAKSGTKRKDRVLAKQLTQTMTFKLDEINADNLRLFFRADEITDIAEGTGTVTSEIARMDRNEDVILGQGYSATAIVVNDLSGTVTYVANTDYEVVDILGGFKAIRRKGDTTMTDSSETGTVAGTVSSSGLSILLDAVGGTYSPTEGDILKVPTTNELLLVTDVSGTTPNYTLTVERGYAGTTKQTIADNAVLTKQTLTGSAIPSKAFVQVGYSYIIRANKEIRPTTKILRYGKVVFIGASDTGNEFIQSFQKIQLEPSGSFDLNSDNWTEIEFKMEVLDNSDVTPLAPYGVLNHYGVGTNL